MAEIGFYHLTRSTPAQALPPLLTRTLEAGHRALVLGTDGAALATLSTMLWEQTSWLPHGTAADGDADLQPIWLTTEPEAANGARYLFLIDGATTDQLAGFDRVFDLFDGTDEASVAAARVRWRAAREAGHSMTYWQQGERGWQQKS